MIFLLNFIFWVSPILRCFFVQGNISLPIPVSEGYVDISDALTNLQLFGGLLIGVGLYAFVDKWQATGLMKVETVYDVILNISLVMVIAGGVIFIVSFAGCVGALRENTCLLKFVSGVIYNSVCV